MIDEDKVTNPQVASRVAGSGRMVEAELALNEAAAILAACTEARDAIKVKRDMLVQLNKNQQSEMRVTSPVIPKVDAPPAGDEEKEFSPSDTLFGEPIPAVNGPSAEEPAAALPDVSDCV